MGKIPVLIIKIQVPILQSMSEQGNTVQIPVYIELEHQFSACKQNYYKCRQLDYSRKSMMLGANLYQNKLNSIMHKMD